VTRTSSSASEMGALRRSRPARGGTDVFAAAFLAWALEVEGAGLAKGSFPVGGGGNLFGADVLRASAWVVSLPLE
jgi:hypothetical protein